MTETNHSGPVFPTIELDLDGRLETVAVGGHHLLPKLPEALVGVDVIGVIGWGPQGRAQACNLRDSLRGTGIRVTVGLRPESPSWRDAEAHGFTEATGTLGEMFEVIAQADLVLLLIADAAQVELYPKIFELLQPGATLGLSHGFLIGHLDAVGDALPAGVNVIGVCPKGMGASVRRLYEQGSGINASFAVEQDIDGWATDLALAWAVGIGAPYAFRTTLRSELRSDVFGERAILLGAVHGIVEALYRQARDEGDEEEVAFERACESLTGPLARTLSRQGIAGVLSALTTPEARAGFGRAYAATYGPAAALLEELYDEVDSGRELQSVSAAVARLARHPLAPVETTPMWEAGRRVRVARDSRPAAVPIDARTAGVFLAVMVAQIDLLRAKGHPWSEIANESVIEAVDSLIPYMHSRGVAHMIDNCSTTARIGARRWGPAFEAMVAREVLPALHGDGTQAGAGAVLHALETHPVHAVLRTLAELRPPIDIAVS